MHDLAKKQVSYHTTFSVEELKVPST